MTPKYRSPTGYIAPQAHPGSRPARTQIKNTTNLAAQVLSQEYARVSRGNRCACNQKKGRRPFVVQVMRFPHYPPADNGQERRRRPVTDQLFPISPVGQTTPTEKKPVPRVYPKNHQWDALEELFGAPRTDSNQRLYGKISNELSDAGYSKADIFRAAQLYHVTYGRGIRLTVTALIKHIDQLMYEAQKEAAQKSYRSQPRLVVLPELEAM